MCSSPSSNSHPGPGEKRSTEVEMRRQLIMLVQLIPREGSRVPVISGDVLRGERIGSKCLVLSEDGKVSYSLLNLPQELRQSLCFQHDLQQQTYQHMYSIPMQILTWAFRYIPRPDVCSCCPLTSRKSSFNLPSLICRKPSSRLLQNSMTQVLSQALPLGGIIFQSSLIWSPFHCSLGELKPILQFHQHTHAYAHIYVRGTL